MINYWPQKYQNRDADINRYSLTRQFGEVVDAVLERSPIHRGLLADEGLPCTVAGMRQWYRVRTYFKVGEVELTRLPSARR